MSWKRSWLHATALTLTLANAPAASGQGTPIGFEEDFALATDRAAAIEALIPGTEDYYYYSCLHQQNVGAFDEVPPLLRLWTKRYGRTARALQIENRQALLTYDRNPDSTLDKLRRDLGLRFDHRPQRRGEEPDLPTRLDPSLLSREALTRNALARHPRSLDGFENSALEFLISADLDPDRLHQLLERLERPDFPQLPTLIVRDLGRRDSRPFGSLKIHRLLLLPQLEACVQERPALLNDPEFVKVYLPRLQPEADTRWQRDTAARQQYFNRLESFAARLAPAHNSLKAHVLYHRLVHDRALGRYDKQRFMTYLRLPRVAPHVNPEYLRRHPSDRANLAESYPTGMEAIGNDEALVKSYLEHFFQTEDAYEPYAQFVQGTYLKRLFAETKILAGKGDRERWYSLLDDPAYYEQLRDRVEIEFAPTQKTEFGAADPVTVDVHMKNVETLLVKVFEIDTFQYYAQMGRELDASINLDGLVANQESSHNYEINPLLRVRRSFKFPELSKPGAFVIEFIGNGISSRALIQKGRLEYVERIGSAGHVFQVIDEDARQRKNATIWLAGREYRPDEDGEIVVPYSTEPGPQYLILRSGDLATLTTFQHQAESYELHAAIYLDRENLLARRKAAILVRPTLTVNGIPASLDLLENVQLDIQATDLDGVASSQTIRDFPLFEDRESVHEISVPENLSALNITLRGRVRDLSHGKAVDLSDSSGQFRCNAIDATEQTSCALMGRSSAGYALDVLGKSGEPSGGRAVSLELRHRDYRDPVRVTLKTDANGRIELGRLEQISSVQAHGIADQAANWTLRPHARTYTGTVQGEAGEVLRIPYQGSARRPARTAVSLLEKRGGAYAYDRIDRVAIRGGYVELAGLAPGDYDLWLKEANRHFSVKVTRGTLEGDWVFGAHRKLQLDGGTPLHVTGIEASDENVAIQLSHAGPDARVHVVATRYLLPYDFFARLRSPSLPGLADLGRGRALSSYHSGREIGDEYRYILDRRLAKKFPGNMLQRPGLLLNPWDLSETSMDDLATLNDTVGVGGGAGGGFGGRYGKRGSARGGGGSAAGIFPNLEFLPDPSVVLTNLRPDDQGLVRVARADLGPGQQVHVVAVDAESTVYSSMALDETPMQPRDLRFLSGLDPNRHFTEQKRIEFVEAGGTTTIDDLKTSTVEVYDSIASVYRLFTTLTNNSDLRKFDFILRWPKLSQDEKCDYYSRFACHELHLFIHQKDPDFFASVVRPYLVNKMDKSFLDHWLLEEDLSAYLDPWAFQRLNVVERILLARRLPELRASTARHLRELFDLIPPDPDRTRRHFETALRGSVLDSKGGIGQKLREEGRALLERAKESAPAAPARIVSPEDMPAEEPVLDALELVESEELEEEMDKAGGEARRARASLSFFKKNKDVALREKQEALYRAPERTREYVEHHYWHLPIAQMNAALITVDAFWLDFAEKTAPFYSEHLTEAAGNFAEMMLALSVLDLPFEPGEHVTKIDGARATLETASPMLLVRKEIREAIAADSGSKILVRQDFFRLDDRFANVGNERVEKYVSGEFLTDVVYGGQVVVTNPASASQRLELLLQIPRGAIPVRSGFTTRSTNVELGPYSTTREEYHFYFPEAEEALHFPVHVSRDGSLIGQAEPVALQVVRIPSTVDTSSWRYVSQNSNGADVLAYLDQANLQRTDLSQIAWRLRNRGFFDNVLARLRARHVYDPTTWSYGLHHRDLDTMREYLRHQDAYLARCGPALESTLISIDPIERRSYQHVEYRPLFNARAHQIGKQRTILNRSFAGQFRALLDILACRPQLDDGDWLSVTYALLLQDRIEEALTTFARVDPDQLPVRLQYDYMRAYLDFFSDSHQLARSIAEQYRDYPVPRWSSLFQEVLNQLDEAQGAEVLAADSGSQTQQQTALAARQPGLDLEVEARRVAVQYQNIDQVEVSYYPMDIEFLFSTSPFVQQGSGAFSYVRPNRREQISLPDGQNQLVFDLPEEFHSSNVLVEIRGGGLSRRQAYYANSLAVQMVESYGQLKVTHAASKNPLSKVYVKVYARTRSGFRFHKDGYTDLRGRFDYVSRSGEMERTDRYAVLVMSETDGAIIREVEPPKQ